MRLAKIWLSWLAFAGFFVAYSPAIADCNGSGTCALMDNGVPGGAGLYVVPSGGSTSSTLAAFMQRLYYVDDFCGSSGCGGVSDWTSVINTAASQVSTNGGGTICLNPTRANGYVAATGNITIPGGVTLDGCAGPLSSSPATLAGWLTTPSTLRTSGSYTINVSGNLRHMNVINNALPSISTLQGALTAVAAFSGTGVTLTATDAELDHVFIGGYSTCVSAASIGRSYMTKVYGDCTNGMSMSGEGDIPRMLFVEFWPFLTNGLGITSRSITAAADNGSGIYRLTVGSTSGFAVGNSVGVWGMTGAQGADLGGSGPGQRWTIAAINSGAGTIDLTGAYTAPAGVTGSTTNLSAYMPVTFTGTATINNLAIGQSVSGTNIPGGTTITAVWPLNSAVTLSAAATGTASGTALTITNSAYSSGGTIGIDADYRPGTGFAWGGSNQDHGECYGCFAFEYALGFDFKSQQLEFVCNQCSYDANWTAYQGAGLVAIKVEGTSGSYGNLFSGGYISAAGWVLQQTSTNASQEAYPTTLRDIVINTSGSNIMEQINGSVNLINVNTESSGQILIDDTNFLGTKFGDSTDIPNVTILTRSGNLNSAFLRKDATARLGSAYVGIGQPYWNSETLTSSVGSSLWMLNNSLGADLKTWQVTATSSGNWGVKACTDNLSSCNNALAVIRGTTNTITSLNFYTASGTQGGLLDANQHWRLGNTTAPTIASGACGTGTNGTIASGSNDHSGTVNIGASATTTCTISFGSAWTTAPRVCNLMPANSAAAAWGTTGAYVNPSNITTAQFVITGSALASANFNYECF